MKSLKQRLDENYKVDGEINENMDKEVWEGWTVGDFIKDLEPQLDMIQKGDSWAKELTTKAELKKWCMDNQSYYKKFIPEVVNYFAKKYNLK